MPVDGGVDKENPKSKASASGNSWSSNKKHGKTRGSASAKSLELRQMLSTQQNDDLRSDRKGVLLHIDYPREIHMCEQSTLAF